MTLISADSVRNCYAATVGGRTYDARTYAIMGGGLGVTVFDFEGATDAGMRRAAQDVMDHVGPGWRVVRVYRRTDLPGAAHFDAYRVVHLVFPGSLTAACGETVSRDAATCARSDVTCPRCKS